MILYIAILQKRQTGHLYHNTMALVVFLPRPENQVTFWLNSAQGIEDQIHPKSQGFLSFIVPYPQNHGLS